MSLVAYLLHDKRQSMQHRATWDDPHPETSDRVAWSATLGSPTDDIDLTVRIMQGIVADAAIIKERNGRSASGRKLKKPYDHYVLSFHQPPTREKALAAAQDLLQELGLGGRPAIVCAHDDTTTYHVHIAVCRVDPLTGIAEKVERSGLKISAWCADYERRHEGGIQIHNREVRQAAREQFHGEVTRRMQGYTPQGRTKREQSRNRRAFREQVVKQVRESSPPLPPLRPTRGAGRPDRTAAEKEAFSNLYRELRERNAPEEERRAAGIQLRRQLDSAAKARTGMKALADTPRTAAPAPSPPPATPAPDPAPPAWTPPADTVIPEPRPIRPGGYAAADPRVTRPTGRRRPKQQQQQQRRK